MSEELKSAQARIACLEGEIAKRDETIARLEPQLNRAIQANYDLREELAACRVAVENCEVFRARIAELEARIVWLECEAQVNAAPVSEAKAQGVVMPERKRTDWRAAAGHETPNHGWNACLDEVARLNAAPAQQVSVQVSGVPSIKCWSCKQTVSLDDRADADGNCPHCRVELDLEEYLRAMLAASPAAPAADAGLVEALEASNMLLRTKRHACENEQVCHVLDVHIKRNTEALAAHRAQGLV